MPEAVRARTAYERVPGGGAVSTPLGQKIETAEKRGVVCAGVALPGGLGYGFLGWPHRESGGMEDG